MTGRDFLHCAERLAKSTDEADFRTAVSRAYYAAFHLAVALLREHGVRLPKTEQVHVKVVFCLQDCGEPNAASAGANLETLKNQRRAADYDLDAARFRSSATVGPELARARRIVNELDKCRANANFRDAVRAQAGLLGLPVTD